MMDKIIIRNSAICPRCGDEIESKHRHDFVRCSCQFMAVDGGHTYIKRLGSLGKDTSIIAQREPDDLGDAGFSDMQDFADQFHNHGWRPGKADLADAPMLSSWSWRREGQRRIIVGVVTEHPDLQDGIWLATTIVIAIDDDETWMRTTRRLYRLGESA